MWFQAYLNVIMSERASDIENIQNFSFLAAYFGQNKKPRPLFSEYILFLKCTQV